MVSFSPNKIIAGKNYYFSTLTGDDSRTLAQAQNPSTPWKTINKLNSIFTSLLPGDSVLFKRNEIFSGSIQVQKSGSSTLPIVISAYGTGNNPVITGFISLTGWVSSGNGVFQTNAASCKNTLNMVTFNDVPKAIGRYPNSGYLYFESHVGTTSITDNQLSGTPNWTGAEVVIRKTHWVIDRNLITNHSGNTITYNSGSVYPGIDGYGYFIQNDPKTLDQVGEWYLNNTSKNLQMYFGSINPSTCSVKASIIDTLVKIDGYNNISFYNLSFEGANVAAFLLNTADQIRIQKCVINSSGFDAIRICGGSDNSLIDNCIINNTNNTAIYVGVWAGATSTCTITNNKISKTGIVPGMGGNGDDATVGISVDCENSLIQYNEVDTSGYHGIAFDENNTKVKHNLVNHFCSVKDDGAGIYTWKGSYVTQSGNEVINNIVINGVGAAGGTNSTINKSAMGIYMDDYSQNVSITDNTVSNCSGGGLFMGWYAKNITLSNNTSYNNKYQFWSLRNTTVLPNFSIQNNIFFARKTDQFVVLIENSSPLEIGTMDYNFQCRPINDDNSFYVSALPEYLQLNITEWRSAYNLMISYSNTMRPI